MKYLRSASEDSCSPDCQKETGVEYSMTDPHLIPYSSNILGLSPLYPYMNMVYFWTYVHLLPVCVCVLVSSASLHRVHVEFSPQQSCMRLFLTCWLKITFLSLFLFWALRCLLSPNADKSKGPRCQIPWCFAEQLLGLRVWALVVKCNVIILRCSLITSNTSHYSLLMKVV